MGSIEYEFNNKANHTTKKALNSRSKPTPSKWDDAQKWLIGSKSNPRNSNAEDSRLLSSIPYKPRDSCSSIDSTFQNQNLEETETKKMGFIKPIEETTIRVGLVCLRDIGTEMTPIASKEHSRTCSPIGLNFGEGNSIGFDRNLSCLELRAMAWDEAERTKYMARYKREEVKIQAWENREMRKAKMDMKRIEAKAERMKLRAQEKLANKIASTRRRAEEKRLIAEAKLNERAARTSERADYIRRAGHLQSSILSFKLPSFCG